ncbi:E3 ubiquitin/ISG15 ligase TRIM25-like [Neoarius graeffei]|uniref:E3 ubiquitin/ISG15 ligase TRIM25-like n=1 Tax=Neoarius graeffei TaxID=443677 RepID=UPI00298D2A1A|nr:E3 ubiquitin/ISG15 ligase TRIM25-like [Neoarius graeffei]
MAEAGISVDHFSVDQFSCPVCLDLLKDPVAIPCGHSFCKVCINGCWDQEDVKGVYSCPLCRETFTPRPVLYRNNMLAEVVEKLKKNELQAASPAHCYAGPGDVECDSCTGRKYKAVKSCLVCQASYCEAHLKPHYQSPAFKKHKLVEACAELQEKICSEHGKLIEIFCHTDQCFICYLCTTDEHKGHETVSTKAERNEKQNELKEEQMKSQQRIQEKQKEVQELKQAVDTIKMRYQAAVDDSERIFTEMISSMEKKRSVVTELIRAQEKAELNQAERLLKQLEQEIADLQRRVTELEQLSHTHDHIHFSDHAAIFLMPKYIKKLKVEAPACREVTRWSNQSVAILQDALNITDWDLFWHSSGDDINVFTEAVVGFIGKLAEDCAPKSIVRTFPNQKPWVDNTIRDTLRSRTAAYNTGLLTGNMEEFKAASYNVRKAVKEAKRRYGRKLEDHLYQQDPRGLWQGLQIITDYKSAHTPLMNADKSLADELNNFYAHFKTTCKQADDHWQRGDGATGTDRGYSNPSSPPPCLLPWIHYSLPIVPADPQMMPFLTYFTPPWLIWTPRGDPTLDWMGVLKVQPQTNLTLNTSKMKELIVNFSRKQQRDPSASTGPRRLKDFKLPLKVLRNFYSCTIESVLSGTITNWMGSTTRRDQLALRRVVHSAERTIRTTLPDLQDIYSNRCRDRARKIASNPSHPNNRLFSLLPSGRRYRQLKANTERTRRSFFPQAIELFIIITRNIQYLTLDPNTVNPELILSEKNRAVTRSGTEQRYSDHPERFDSKSQVLCKESVCGRCYWEVEWRGLGVDISVSYKEISRKGWGDTCMFGFNSQSWSLECFSSSVCFRHNNIKTVLRGPSSSRIGVYVDHSAGTLSFYSVSDPMRLLHRVHTTFTQPLYAGVWIGSDSTLRFCELMKK